MKRMKAEKGITLVALVITIIVMLILVGVTITIALNEGLFEKARYARDETINALESENSLGSGSVTVKKGNTEVTIPIDNIVDGSY